MSADDADETYWAYRKSIFGGLLGWVGWTLGWSCYALARVGMAEIAGRLVDAAIKLRRGNPGAIRTVGFLNGRKGRLALRRGRVLVEGQVHASGPFANQHFFAAYDVAARDAKRALQLIERWEWDAVPGSLKVIEAEFEADDFGAEGILWVSNGRTFFNDS